MLDPACNSKSQIDFSEGFFLSQKTMIWFWDQLINSKDNIDDPVFNLTRNPKVHLPKTLIITAGFDPLSDEGEAYARLIHGFVNMTSLKAAKDAAKDWIKSYKNFLN